MRIIIGWQARATDAEGRVFASNHRTKAEAEKSAACCRGKYPYGNRVKVVPLYDGEPQARLESASEWAERVKVLADMLAAKVL